MSESRTDTSAAGPSEGRSEHERDHEEFQAGTGYQPSTNQARDEPVPASVSATMLSLLICSSLTGHVWLISTTATLRVHLPLRLR